MQQETCLRGVNLGGWLLLEKWMTPSLFKNTQAVDEYTFMKTAGAKAKIKKHRQTFITEEDFKWLAENSIDAVRIPIGYWILQNDEPYIEGIAYLDWAVEIAAKYNILVLIDLHGAKGSQNGKDHSGKIGKANWFKNNTFREQTLETLEKLAIRYKHNKNVWGLELLNEPLFGLFHFKLRKFYKEAYMCVSHVARPGLKIIFHDAFTPRLMSGAMKKKNVVMDIHWYQFTVFLAKFYNLKRYFNKVNHRKDLVNRLQKRQPVIIGEWSVVLSGKILNGASKNEEKELFKYHSRIQMDAYKNTAGWFYWTYKTEGRGIWNFRSLVEDKVITLD